MQPLPDLSWSRMFAIASFGWCPTPCAVESYHPNESIIYNYYLWIVRDDYSNPCSTFLPRHEASLADAECPYFSAARQNTISAAKRTDRGSLTPDSSARS